MRQVLLLSALLLALLASFAATPLLIALPPRIATPAAKGEFDELRAKTRLAMILGDVRVHPADSFGDDAVRARLIGQIRSMGLNPIVRDQFACNTIYKQRGVTCARVRNVIVALGPASGKALLLNAHYDSTSVGPAAADDGAGVATLLETASILKTERLKRPLIFLFNEGEELGLVGARAFMHDPLSDRVDSLINLEARGTTGPVTMFETSLPNGPPVHAFARAVERPFANSMATDFYRQLPNYTDVNSFSERGWLTLNFAMIGNETRYHSPGDTVAALDARSLRHMGDQTLALARELAEGRPAGRGTVLFADIAGRQLVVIPAIAGFTLLGLLTIGFAAIAFRRRGLWRGLLLVLAGILASAALAWAGLYVMGLLRAGSFWRAHPTWTWLAADSCGLLAAVAALLFVGRRLAIEQLRAIFWLGFLLLGVAVFVIAPGDTIYFLLPPLVAIIGIMAQRWLPVAEWACAFAAAALLWLTFGEVLALLGQLMVNGPFFAFAPLAFIIAMPWLIEARELVERPGRIPAMLCPAAILLACWAAVFAAPAYSADRQQRFVIQHVTNEVTGKAYWLVVNDGPPLPNGFGGVKAWAHGKFPYIDRTGWIAPAPVIPGAKPPRLDVLDRTIRGNLRTVRARIAMNGADSVGLIGTKDSQIVSAGTGDFIQPFAADAKGNYLITCFGRSCDGQVLQFTTKVKVSMGFSLVGANRGLPPFAQALVEDRPPFARPQYMPDSALTISRIWL